MRWLPNLFKLIFCLFPFLGCALTEQEEGRLFFLIQQGQHQKALECYVDICQNQGRHQYELLHRIGLSILDEGFRQNDPETQLLSLFGASISAHDEVFYILEESLKSRYPPIQLIGLQALAKFRNDRADDALVRAIASRFLPIRLEAVHQLCLKQHPQALAQAESLMYKTPKSLMAIYPQLFVLIENEEATRQLKRLFNHKSESVRVAAILSAAKHHRDDLLSQIRLQATHLQCGQQEASAYALGVLKDEQSISKLQRLTKSAYTSVALAAYQALYRLGKKEESRQWLEAQAKKGDLFATTILKDVPESADTLIALSRYPDRQVRINATLALAKQRHVACLEGIKEILIRDKYDLAFVEQSSPGHALKSWKVVPSASVVLKDDASSYVETIQLREHLLSQLQDLSETDFLRAARLVFDYQQNELVPKTIHLLEELDTPAVIDFLKSYQQKPGAPLIRQYCNLALYRLHEPGPYQEQLIEWVKSQNQEDLIRFRPLAPYDLKTDAYELTPEETSRLLIEAFEALALQQDEQGIQVLIQALQTGNAKNKYALAGLLLRATQ